MDTNLAILILGVVNCATLLGHYFYVKETNKEKKSLMNAVVSKNAVELRDLELTQKVEPIKPFFKEPDLVPESELSNEEFEKLVSGVQEESIGG